MLNLFGEQIVHKFVVHSVFELTVFGRFFDQNIFAQNRVKLFFSALECEAGMLSKLVLETTDVISEVCGIFFQLGSMFIML